jgi:RNA polymerase sigma-70 factor (ECF subfamily)
MDRQEVEVLYRQHGPALLAYAAALLRCRSLGEDVLHQVFLSLMKSRSPMPCQPKAYLFQSVRNTAQNVHRNTARDVSLDDADTWFVAPSGRAEDSLVLQKALLQIPDEQCEAIVLRVWGEMTFEEIARVAGVSPNTAASRYRYGLNKLRGLLEPAEVNQHAAKR